MIDIVLKDRKYFATHRGHGDLETSIVLGGMGDKFVPNINASSWNDEAWLNINFPQIVTNEKETFDVDKKSVGIELAGLKHQFYFNGNDELEYEVIFNEKPQTNKVVFSLDFSSNLLFFYQPPLNPNNDWDKRAYRPPDIVGSYAVYLNKKNNQYCTGKFCHIKRPRVKDDAGHEIFADLFIDPVAKTLTITIDQLWLDDATYPIILDPTIGYNVAGGTSNTIGNYIDACRFYCFNSGDANPGTFYIYGDSTSGDQNIICGTYQNNVNTVSGQPKLSTSDPIIVVNTTLAWRNGSITWINLAAGTDYWLACNGQANARIYYDSTTPGYEDTEYVSRTYDGTLPNPFSGGVSSVAAELSIYVDYTEQQPRHVSPSHYSGFSRRYNNIAWQSGRQLATYWMDFWSPTLTFKDPEIPHLPLESPSVIVKIINETIEIIENIVKVTTGLPSAVIKIVNETLELLEGKVVATLLTLVKLIFETIEISESFIRRLRTIKIVNETERIIEGLVRRMWAIKIMNETERIVEGIIKRLRAVKIISDTIQILESLVQRSRAIRLIAETIQISEGKVIKTFTQLIKIISETIIITEGIVKKATTFVKQIVNETLNLIEGIVRKGMVVRLVNEIAELAESFVRRMWAVPIVNESVLLIENVTRRMWAIKIISETVRIIDSLVKWTSGKIETFIEAFRASRAFTIFEAAEIESFRASRIFSTINAQEIGLKFRAIKRLLGFKAE